MKAETCAILARHFSDDLAISLVMYPDATPSTNGETITLPSNISDTCTEPLLGALLHECFHNRHSDPCSDIYEGCSNLQRHAINALEDVRIDNLLFAAYPNSQHFLTALNDQTIATALQALRGECYTVQLLKRICLHGHSYNPKSQLYSDEVEQRAAALAAKYIPQTLAAESTTALKPIALALAAELRQDAMNKAEQQRREQLQQPGAGAPGTASGKQSDTQSNESSEQSSNDKTNAERDEQSAADTVKRCDNLDKRIQAQRDQLTKQREDMKDEHNASGTKEDRKRELSDMYYATDKRTTTLNKRLDRVRDQRDKAASALQLANEAREAMLQRLQLTPGSKRGVALLDIGALASLGKATLTTPTEQKAQRELDPFKTLSDSVRQALILKQERVQADDDGSRLNAARLAHVYTDGEQLFTQQRSEERKTHIALVLDISGSMGSYECADKRGLRWRELGLRNRAELAIDLTTTLCNALQDAIQAGAPGDFSLHLFGTNSRCMIPTAADFKASDLPRLYSTASCELGDGTNLSKALQRLADDLEQIAPNDERIALIITDAELANTDLRSLINHVNDKGSKFIFIGAQVNLAERSGNAQLEQARREIFAYNVDSASDALEVLRRALTEQAQLNI